MKKLFILIALFFCPHVEGKEKSKAYIDLGIGLTSFYGNVTPYSAVKSYTPSASQIREFYTYQFSTLHIGPKSSSFKLNTSVSAGYDIKINNTPLMIGVFGGAGYRESMFQASYDGDNQKMNSFYSTGISKLRALSSKISIVNANNVATTALRPVSSVANNGRILSEAGGVFGTIDTGQINANVQGLGDVLATIPLITLNSVNNANFGIINGGTLAANLKGLGDVLATIPLITLNSVNNANFGTINGGTLAANIQGNGAVFTTIPLTALNTVNGTNFAIVDSGAMTGNIRGNGGNLLTFPETTINTQNGTVFAIVAKSFASDDEIKGNGNVLGTFPAATIKTVNNANFATINSGAFTANLQGNGSTLVNFPETALTTANDTNFAILDSGVIAGNLQGNGGALAELPATEIKTKTGVNFAALDAGTVTGDLQGNGGALAELPETEIKTKTGVNFATLKDGNITGNLKGNGSKIGAIDTLASDVSLTATQNVATTALSPEAEEPQNGIADFSFNGNESATQNVRQEFYVTFREKWNFNGGFRIGVPKGAFFPHLRLGYSLLCMSAELKRKNPETLELDVCKVSKAVSALSFGFGIDFNVTSRFIVGATFDCSLGQKTCFDFSKKNILAAPGQIDNKLAVKFRPTVVTFMVTVKFAFPSDRSFL